MNVRRRLFGADRRLSTRILVTAVLLAVGVRAVVALVAPGWRGFRQVVAPTYAWIVYVNFSRIPLLVCAPAAVAYRNNGWLPAVGVGTLATYATVPETGVGLAFRAAPDSSLPAVVDVALAAVGTGLWVGSIGYLLGVVARYLVHAPGRVGTPG